jgi:glycosyltransferase involved in cell wall biosynthesis
VRVLFLNHNLRHLGTFSRGRGMAEALARRGHEVALMTVSPRWRFRAARETVNGVRVWEMPSWGQGVSGEGYGPLDNLLRIGHALLRRYDIIHMLDHKPNASFAGFTTGRWRSACLIADWADWWGGPGGINDVPHRRFPIVGRFEAWWEIRSKLWADGVVAVSTVLRERALQIGCPPERVLWLPNGTEPDAVRCMPIAAARRELNVPPDRHIVGFLGMGQGDMEVVMNALRQLPDVWLMVVGPENARVLGQARAFGIAERLWQTGFVPEHELSLYLACADVMCVPMVDRAANRGRLPGKLSYYMAAGRPTVASPIGDVRALVESERVGLLADEPGFAAALDRLLRDPELRAELGRNARRAAENTLSWSRLADRLENFYHRMLARQRSPGRAERDMTAGP